MINRAKERIKDRLDFLFAGNGVTVLVDGQFGSTGKGVIAGLLAELFHSKVKYVLSNAGPNSGHTFYGDGGKIILKQLPTFSVRARQLGNRQITTFLTAGAVIDPDIFDKERLLHGLTDVVVHPNAAIITENERSNDQRNVDAMASTGQGVGPALIAKLQRSGQGVVHQFRGDVVGNWNLGDFSPLATAGPAFMEISQGFSLGINSGFYPYVTTRECTVSQGLSDAGLPPTFFDHSVMTVRTFPIRVGNVGDASSGPGYPDQKEISWEELGQPAEYTTVTKRVRRVFTWSRQQYRAALAANAPSVIFLNFVNYLKDEASIDQFVREYILQDYADILGHQDIPVLLGRGPRSEDVELWQP